jgi:hypothetical protein
MKILSIMDRSFDLLQGGKDQKANAAKETIFASNHHRNDFTAALTPLASSVKLPGSIR